MSHADYNKNHGYDEESVKDHIKDWCATMIHNDKLRDYIDENADDLFKNKQQARKWKDNNVDSSDIRKFNLARNRAISGLTQFFDGIGDLLDISKSSVLDQNMVNLMGIIAFSKSTAYDKIGHWADAEKACQEDRDIDLPGSTCKKGGKEKVQRPEESERVWYGLQFMYRQLGVFQFVPHFDVVSGIWNLVAGQDRDVVSVLDHWYYIHKSQIKEKQDLTEILSGYFFRFNAKMTTRAQAETLYVLNSLFNHSGSKPLGTIERPPWFEDSVICSERGNLKNSTNVTTDKIDKKQARAIKKAPLTSREMDGVRTVPSEPEDYEEFEDEKIASRVVNKKYDSKKELMKDVQKKEKSRKGEKGYFKGKDGLHDQHWDQDDSQSYDQGYDPPDGADVESESSDLEEKILKRGQGSVFYDDDCIARKIIDSEGNSVKRLETDRGKVYRIGREL